MKTLLQTYLSRLTVGDIPELEKLETAANLNFWGEEHYRKFLGEMPEYFGCKVTVLPAEGASCLAGFFLARSVLEQLEILKVGVLPEFQNRGIGTQLMESAYSEGRRRGCNQCFLEVRQSNSNAIRFYLGQRFHISASRQDYYTNPVEDAWVMERWL